MRWKPGLRSDEHSGEIAYWRDVVQNSPNSDPTTVGLACRRRDAIVPL